MPTRQRTAFTIIELLVVITIIALLVSILLPALATARNSARVAVCAANLHQVGVAVNMYQADWSMETPWLFTSGTGDHPTESYKSTFPHLPGNPANALVEHNSYLPTAEILFCPLASRRYPDDYSPLAKIDPLPAPSGLVKIWGTYSWLYPHLPEHRDPFDYDGPRPVPKGTHSNSKRLVGPRARDVVMTDAHPWQSLTYMNWDYPHYNGLFMDLRVELVARDQDAFDLWCWGEVGWPLCCQ